MRTLLNLVVVFAAAAGTAMAHSRGYSQAGRPRAGYRPTPPVYQDSFHNAENPRGRKAATRTKLKVFQYSFNYDGANGCDAPTGQDGNVCGQDAAGLGDYLTSLARMNELQMQRMAIENQRLNAENELRLRKLQAELREAEKQKRMALIRERNAARPRAVQRVNAVFQEGRIAWPAFLQDESYAAWRDQVKQVLQQKARTGQVSADDRREITEATERMLEELKANVQNMRPQEYVAVKSFARGLLAELQGNPSRDDRAIAGF